MAHAPLLAGTAPAFASRAEQIHWWARLGPRFVPISDQIRVRWLAPDGHVVQDEEARRPRKPFITSQLAIDEPGALAAGTWTVEALLDGDVIDQLQFGVTPD